jgi:hypothetical protein
MTFAVSSPVGRNGKITVRAPTPEAALAWAGKLRDSNRAEVIITSIATGVQLSEELKARVLKHDLNGGNERSLNAVLHRIDPIFQSHLHCDDRPGTRITSGARGVRAKRRRLKASFPVTSSSCLDVLAQAALVILRLTLTRRGLCPDIFFT